MAYRMRRNPGGTSAITGRNIAIVIGAYAVYKAAQGGALGLPAQSLTNALGEAGNAISRGTAETIDIFYKRAPVPVTTPSGTPPAAVGTGAGTVTGANRLNPPVPGTAVDLGAYDPSAGGFAWDGQNVFTIAEHMIIGTAQTAVEAAAAAKLWYANNGRYLVS